MIAGAGMAGLIAAHMMPGHDVYERDAAHDASAHAALLRFKTNTVSDATGIKFDRVTVHKGIWWRREWHQPSIEVANLYAQKVVGRLEDRSIWNISPAERWIAPPDFYARMIEGLGGRIHWGCAISPPDATLAGEAFISTMPLPSMLRCVGIDAQLNFSSAPIFVKRFKIEGANVYQTVYFPEKEHRLYRASITGDVLICEFANAPEDYGPWRDEVASAFALDDCQIETSGEDVKQQFGKISPIREDDRKALMLRLTDSYGIYSLGRFATWRNIMLDDVVKDVQAIKRLIHAGDYARKLYY